MKKKVLIGLSGEGNTWGATALDYPGCVTVGDSAAEAREMMVKALAMHIRGTIEDGEVLPEDIDDYAVVDVEVPVVELATTPTGAIQ